MPKVKKEETELTPAKTNLKEELLFSITSGLIFSSLLWSVESALFFFSKLRNPGIWFYIPLKILGLYLVTGTILAVLSWLVSVVLLKKRNTIPENFRRFFSAIFISLFLSLYLFIFYLLKVAHLTLEGFLAFAINTALIILVSTLTGTFISRSLSRVARLRKISLLFSLTSILLLILFNTAFDINGKTFPEVPDDFLRQNSSRPNVLLIAVDSLRADRLSCMGYKKIKTPNIDRLAREGILFSNCITTAPWTLPSFGSIFTSLYPSQHGAEMNQVRKQGPGTEIITLSKGFLYEKNTTLSEILTKYGYYSVFFQPNITAGSPAGFNQGVDFYFDCYKYKNLLFERFIGDLTGRKLNQMLYSSFVYAGDKKIASYVENWLKKNHDKQFFMHVLLFDCHEFHLKNSHGLDKKTAEELYNNKVRKVDKTIGKIYEILKKSDLLENTIIVLLSDHGEELYDHGGYDRGYDPYYDGGIFHSHTLYDELIRIPLIIRYPEKIEKNRQVKTMVRSIDILPTILSLCNIPLKDSFEGTDLTRNNFNPDENLRVFSESILEGPEKKSIRTNEWKLIYHTNSQKYELYDLVHDPGEKINLANSNKEVLDSLKEELFSWMKRMPDKKKEHQEKRKFTKKELEALKALGYIK